ASLSVNVRYRCPGSRSISFFFQAEDGIRDLYVTGVQTCALPISFINWFGVWFTLVAPETGWNWKDKPIRFYVGGTYNGLTMMRRSEERRVGKECRSWWSGNYEKKK